MTTSAPERLYSTRLQYTDRPSKALYIADKYGAILIGSVLDVGCGKGFLRKLVHQPFRYLGVDRSPEADRQVDLDREDLPFEDSQFDTVLCTDVLEHLERCHAVFDEVCRVARRHVLISLPNPLGNMLRSVAAGEGGKIPYYGLRVEAPPDRHRWFFGHDDAVEFVSGRSRRNGFVLEQMDQEEWPMPRWAGPGGANLLEHPNVGGGTMWFVLRRADASGN